MHRLTDLSSSTWYLARRLGQGVIVVLGAITISFFLIHVSGNPARAIAGAFASPDQVKEIESQLGFDRPLGEQFAQYIADVIRGNFGQSYRFGEPAFASVLHALPYTLILVGCALTLTLLVAVPCAIYSVLHRERRGDRALRAGMTVVQGAPEFWLALLLVLVFSIKLGLLPSVGFDEPAGLILPTLALSIPLMPSLLRLIRGQLLDVMSSEFVVALRAKGLSDGEIVVRHGLRNILAPTTIFIALQIGWLLGGTIIVEAVFAWPGIGSLLLSAVSARDVFVIQAIIVVVACGYVLLNLAADIVAVTIDPRIRVASR